MCKQTHIQLALNALRRHNRGKSEDKVREHSVPRTWALELTGGRGPVPKLCICTLPKDFFVVTGSKSNQFGCPLTTGRPKCMAINVAKRVSHSDGRFGRLGSMPQQQWTHWQVASWAYRRHLDYCNQPIVPDDCAFKRARAAH